MTTKGEYKMSGRPRIAPRWAGGVALALLIGGATRAQENAPAPAALTLKRAVELALQNSRDIQIAKIQASVAQHAALITKAEFLPNLYAGSGLGYSNGIPETPGGQAPSVFNMSYREMVLNEPLRGQSRELQEQAKSQRLVLDDVRNAVIVRTAAAYLELAKVRHSLDLLQKEQQSADKILGVTQERQAEGFELPVEVTRAQLTRARITQRILRLEGRQDELEVLLRSQLGLAQDQPIEVTPEDLPGAAEQAGADLIAAALENNSGLRLAESDVRAKELRLRGEKRGRWPIFELGGVYSRLSHIETYDEFFRKFQHNNYNLGMNMQIPLFSAHTKAAINLAQINFDAAKATLANKKNEVSAEVRQKTHRVRELDAAKEVARLELQLAQQNVAVLQSQFDEGKASLRDMENARLEENDKWMAFLDANFQRQQVQLELLRAAGRLENLFQ